VQHKGSSLCREYLSAHTHDERPHIKAAWSLLQVEVSAEVMERQREELRILLGASSLKRALESYLAHHKDPQGIWTFRFLQAVDELQASKSEAPLVVFSKVVKVRHRHRLQRSVQSLRVCSSGREPISPDL
jgi:hypothetical protein